MKSILSICLYFLFISGLWAQPTSYPFADGEFGKYGVYFNWKFIWVQGGEIKFNVATKNIEGKKYWDIQANGNTLYTYDLVYKVRDTFNVYVSCNEFEPLYFRRVMNHGKHRSEHKYNFCKDEKLIYSEITRKNTPTFHDTIPYKKNVNDLLSTSYMFRGCDFSKYAVGEKIPYTMLVDNAIEDLYFRYLGTEDVEIRNGQKFRCHKISVNLMEGDFFHEGEYMKVWLSADRNRVPIQIETEILFGSLKIVLLETKSLRYPTESEIN